MRVVITDSSCLIDLKKGELLRAMLELPFEFMIPQPLMEDELLSLSAPEKQELVDAGLQVSVLTGDQVLRVTACLAIDRRPSVNDYFALILSEDTEESILLTGDGALRHIAEEKAIEVHGAIWVWDLLREHQCVPGWMLKKAIEIFIEDPDVWLPVEELKKRLKAIKG